MPKTAAVERCDRCGRRLVDANHAKWHRRTCAKRHDTPFDGTCPNCGEEYDEYMTHITDCYGGDGGIDR